MDRAEILTRLRERIVRYAASQLRGSSSGDLAQDLAQEVLIVLHEKYSELDRIEDLLPLSLEIARLKIWAARRKSRRRGEERATPVEDLSLAGTEVDPFEHAARGERVARLESALAELGERCRDLFRLKLEGYTFPEIQARLKVATLNTLYTWDFRCRKQLLERLGGDWNKPSSDRPSWDKQ
jgi:RNA polymerase sigma-70 factor, ECF subfamily